MFKRIHQWLFTQAVKKNGIYAPILITKDGVIIDGHHRIDAALELGIDVPTVIVNTTITTFTPLQVSFLKRCRK